MTAPVEAAPPPHRRRALAGAAVGTGAGEFRLTDVEMLTLRVEPVLKRDWAFLARLLLARAQRALSGTAATPRDQVGSDEGGGEMGL